MEYIKARLEILQKKCSEFEACLTELYSAENYHLLLSGSNLQLENICGYVMVRLSTRVRDDGCVMT